MLNRQLRAVGLLVLLAALLGAWGARGEDYCVTTFAGPPEGGLG